MARNGLNMAIFAASGGTSWVGGLFASDKNKKPSVVGTHAGGEHSLALMSDGSVVRVCVCRRACLSVCARARVRACTYMVGGWVGM